MHNITINFPAGLAPSVYSDLCAVLDGQPTSAAKNLEIDRNNCRGALIRLADKLGVPLMRINELLHDDGFDGNNYEAVASVAFEAALTKRNQQT